MLHSVSLDTYEDNSIAIMGDVYASNVQSYSTVQQSLSPVGRVFYHLLCPLRR